MKELSPSDLFEIRPQALFSSQDYDYLIDLYAPIIGLSGVSLFLALSHWDYKEETIIKQFLERNRITITNFGYALDALEAVGLVRTYRTVEDDVQHYAFCVFSPRTPKEFLDNELFAGTFAKCAGTYELERIAEKYKVKSLPEDMEETSLSFKEYFHPDYEDETYLSSTRKTGGRDLGRVKTGFDRNVFMKALKELDPRFSFDSFTKTEFVKIARICSLYNYDETSMASFVRESFVFSKPLGQKLDVDHLGLIASDVSKYDFLKSEKKNSQAHGTSQAAKSIRLMEKLTPIEYLTRLQKGHKPAKPDLDLINTLTVEIGLNNSVCNALLLYVTTNNKNALPGAYTQKIAGSLIREGIETAVDAMDYFTKTSNDKEGRKSSNKKTIRQTQTAKIETEEVESPKPSADDTMSQEEIDDFLDNLDFGD